MQKYDRVGNIDISYSFFHLNLKAKEMNIQRI